MSTNELSQSVSVVEQTALIASSPNAPSISVPDDLPMTNAEFRRLDELEIQIKGSWLVFADACTEIKSSKLYRISRDGRPQTWEEYCRLLGQSKQYIDRTIRAADVIRTLKTETTVSILPVSVSQAAPLSGLKPEEMAKATETAFNVANSEERSVTAKDFTKAVAKLKPQKQSSRKMPPTLPKPKETPQPEAETEPVESTVHAGSTASVEVHVNNADLIEQVREFFKDFGLVTKSRQSANGTTFEFYGTALEEENLLGFLATLSSEGPYNLGITLE